MYEGMTYDYILQEALDSISSDVLKTEGSLIYTAVSAFAFELNRLYVQLDYLLDQLNPETADYETLVALAAQRAVYPDSATYATVRIVADAELPIGARFSLSAYNYAVTEDLGDLNYAAVCEEAGSGPNELLGELTAITYVDSLTTAEITEILIAGADADTRDELYQKYLDSFGSQSFGGNIAAYKEYLNALDGIGGTKVYPVWNGAGTVKCVLISSAYSAVSSYLISQIQDEVSAEPSTGYGFAPINHDTTIESVTEVTVDVDTTITFSSGYSWAVCETEIEEAIENYLLSLRQDWGNGDEDDYITVYISRLESAILDVQGVIDVQNTTLNSTAANLALDTDEVPVLGEVTVS